MQDFDKQPTAHVIRLRGPAWLCHQENGEQKRTRVKTPCDVNPDDQADCFVERNLGGPTGIEPEQRIELAFSNFKNVRCVVLNDQSIAGAIESETEVCIDVTGLIRQHNQIEVHFSAPGHFGDLEMRIFG